MNDLGARSWGVLTDGAVAICGTSAVIAICAALPKNEHSERNLIFTVLSVTVLSTLAMIAYPILTELFEFSDEVSGVFLGGTIHDVVQVVGVGFSCPTKRAKRQLWSSVFVSQCWRLWSY